MKALLAIIATLFKLAQILISVNQIDKKNVMIFIRGVPGSGKSTLAERIATGMNMRVATTDDFFTMNGQFRFDPSNLSLFHTANIIRTFILASQGLNVVIPNTFIEHWEMKIYARIAQHFRMDSVYITLPHPRDSHGNNNIHNVPSHTVERMQSKLRHPKNLHDLVVASIYPHLVDDQLFENAFNIATQMVGEFDENNLQRDVIRELFSI
jgi:predicted kinase